jgi:hypothetical protein
VADLVIGPDGILRNPLRRQAEPVREYAAKEDWKRQKAKKVSCKLDRITSALEEAAQCADGVPPRVTRQYVFARPEPLISRDGDEHSPSGNYKAIDSG